MVGEQTQGLSRIRRLLRSLMPWRQVILRGLLFALPTLLLIPLGLVWLWQHEGVTWWIVGSVTCIGLAVVLGQLWKPHLPPVLPYASTPGASAGEEEARRRIAAIGAEVTSADISSTDAARAISAKVIHEVASAYYPGVKTPTLKVTIPELLLATETTARDLRNSLLQTLPSLRDIDFALVENTLDAKPIVDAGFNFYRIGRFIVAPANALMWEVGRIVGNLGATKLADLAKQRIAQHLVRAVGEGAIRLYSGSCRRDALEIATEDRNSREAFLAPEVTGPVPLQVVLVGQNNSGKSSLVNALLERQASLAEPHLRTLRKLEFHCAHDSHGPVVLLDMQGIETGSVPDMDAIVAADLILWPVALHRADRRPERDLLDQLREWAANNPRRRMPPIVFVGTHSDMLDPVREWAPPYDLETPTGMKGRMIQGALKAAQKDLAWAGARWLVAVTGGERQLWNIDAIRTAIADLRPQAEATRTARLIAERNLGGLIGDAIDTGKSVAGSVYNFAVGRKA